MKLTSWIAVLFVAALSGLAWPVVLYLRRREWQKTRREAERNRRRYIEDEIYA